MNRKLTKIEKKEIRKEIFAVAKRYKWTYIVVVVISLLLRTQMAVTPWIMQQILDNNVDDEYFNQALIFISALFSLLIFGSLAKFAESFILNKFSTWIESDTMEAIYRKVLKLELKNFDVNNEGFFRARLVEDSEIIGNNIIQIPYRMLTVFMTFASSITFIFIYSFEVGIATLLFISILYISYYFQIGLIQKNFKKIRIASDEFNTFLSNSIGGVRETKNYLVESKQLDAYDSVSKKFRKSWQKFFKLLTYPVATTVFTSGLFILSIAGVGAWKIHDGTMTAGAVLALVLYSMQIQQPIALSVNIVEWYTKLNVSIDRVIKFNKLEDEQYEGYPIDITKGDIEFKDVTLYYNAEQVALKNISFKIKAGQKAAFVGQTGSGKSTILKAVSKQYLITEGDILIDGQSIKHSSVNSLRSQITYMSQNSYISFSTVRDNVTFSQNNISNEIYENAINDADAREFIDNLTKKDDTLVGPRGVTLSGGQQQRLGLARSFVADNKVILFDEPTSALDNKTELKVKKVMMKKYKDSTMLMVAHRLTTIQDADVIFVMEKGEIIEVGNHKELMNKKKKYYELVLSSTEG